MLSQDSKAILEKIKITPFKKRRVIQSEKKKFQPSLKPYNKDYDGKPMKYAVTDIETNKWTKFLVLGHYNPASNQFITFRKLDQYLDYLDTHNEPENIFAHFGGKFDFLFILEALVKRDVGAIGSIIPRGSSILSIDYTTKSGKKYVFRDSSALLPFSLKSLCENFHVTHNKLDWDHTKIKKCSPKLLTYLKHDCMALSEVLENFFAHPLIKKVGPRVTMASQAMQVLKLFIKEPIYSLPESSDEFIRKSYLGGRTEIIKPFCETGPLFEYDVNSLYPYVMKNNLYPLGSGFGTNKFEKDLLGIYDCDVECPNLYLPCLGVINNNKYVFPIGRFRGVFTSAEILYAKTLGYKIKINEGHVFQRSSNIFSDFIDELYKIRLNTPKNSVDNVIAKLLMNSSYGRWGMDLNKSNITFDLNDATDEFRELKINRKKVMLFSKDVKLKSFAHVAVASFVTSYARIHMHKLMMPIRDTLYYTDTDSIFTTTQIKTNVGDELGQLKLENTWDSAIFLLPKTYMAKSASKAKIAMKGFDKKKIQGFTMDDFRAALDGDLRRFKILNEPKFATFKSALGQKKFVTMTKANSKQLKAKYDKREIIKTHSQFDTKPITITTQETK